MPRFVVPICSLPRRRSLAWSIATCHGMIRCASPERCTTPAERPRDSSSSTSARNTSGSTTQPAPITQIFPRRTPLGMVSALGADAPEIASAVAAIVAGHEDTGVGVVVGSNVFNLAALLGVSALIAGGVRIHRHGLLLNGGVAVVVATIGAFVAMNMLSGVVGLILALVVLAPYVLLSALHDRARSRL